MFWQDIFINKVLPRAKIISSLSKVFNVEEKEVRLIKDIEDITQNNGSSIICQTYKSNAGFPLRLSVYIVDDKIIPQDEQATVKQISKELGCDILMSEASSNPYLMLCIGSGGSITQVSIDIEEYDNAEEFDLL